MSIFKLVAGIVFNVVFFAAFLFVPAGTLHWPQAWVFLGVVLISTIVSTIYLYRVDRGLLEERFKPPLQKGQPFSDKIIVSLLIVAIFGLIAFIPLDVFRWRLLPAPDGVVSWLGLLLFIGGWWLMSVAMGQNAFAAPVVKHQEERHQTVIDSGVYGIVRHPMYAGVLPWLAGMSLWLGSYAAALLSCLPVAVLAVRIVFEERFLRRELTGYDAYVKKVRYRLIPYIW